MKNVKFEIKISMVGQVGRHQTQEYQCDTDTTDKICLNQAKNAASTTIGRYNRSETFEVELTPRKARIQLADYSFGEGTTWDVVGITSKGHEKYSVTEIEKLDRIAKAATDEARGRTSDNYVEKSGYWSND